MAVTAGAPQGATAAQNPAYRLASLFLLLFYFFMRFMRFMRFPRRRGGIQRPLHSNA